MIKVPTKTIWENSFENETGRLAQVVGNQTSRGTNTVYLYQSQKFRQTGQSNMDELWMKCNVKNPTHIALNLLLEEIKFISLVMS